MDGPDASGDAVTAFLEHHGVKGMKWGVRKDKGHEGQQAKTSKIAKLDKKFEKRANSDHTFFAVYNHAARLTNDHDVDRINNKPQYRNADFTHDSPLREKYYREHEQAFLKNLNKAAAAQGTNASGTRQYKIVHDNNGNWAVTTTEVKHADGGTTFTVKVVYDNMGHILRLEMPPDAMAQSDLTYGDVLEHFGVKGMKWGVRKRSSDSGSGTQHAPSADAKSAMDARNKLATQGGIKALSNEELQGLVKRMQLEKQYSELVGKARPATPSKKAAKFVSDFLVNFGKQEASKIMSAALAKQLVPRLPFLR